MTYYFVFVLDFPMGFDSSTTSNTQNSKEADTQTEDLTSEDFLSINIDIKSTNSSRKSCFICRRTSNQEKQSNITRSARIQALFERRIWINERVHCCFKHLDSKTQFTFEALNSIEIKRYFIKRFFLFKRYIF
jgi:hypothetical protein